MTDQYLPLHGVSPPEAERCPNCGDRFDAPDRHHSMGGCYDIDPPAPSDARPAACAECGHFVGMHRETLPAAESAKCAVCGRWYQVAKPAEETPQEDGCKHGHPLAYGCSACDNERAAERIRELETKLTDPKVPPVFQERVDAAVAMMVAQRVIASNAAIEAQRLRDKCQRQKRELRRLNGKHWEERGRAVIAEAWLVEAYADRSKMSGDAAKAYAETNRLRAELAELRKLARPPAPVEEKKGCPTCDGSGMLLCKKDPYPCSRCGGTGWVTR